MIIAYDELRQLVHDGVITNVEDDMINGSSIDVTLASTLLTEARPPVQFAASAETPQRFHEWVLSVSSYEMPPGVFLLAATEQGFNLPLNISAQFFLRSTMARLGLDHLAACWCDPGWQSESLTLELKNVNRFHGVRLTHGMRIGQVVFYRHAPIPATVSYKVRGKYNHMTNATPAKPEIR